MQGVMDRPSTGSNIYRVINTGILVFQLMCQKRAQLIRRGLAVIFIFYIQIVQAYPDRPIHLVVPFTAGGNVDVSARIIAQALSAELGKTVIVENHPGANALIGAEFAARSPADGYTLFLGTAETLAINPHIYQKINYDAIKNFRAVGLIGQFPFALVVSPNLPVKDVKDFVNFSRNLSNSLNYASWGVGSTSQIAFEKFSKSQGLEFVHIPFLGAAPAVSAVAAEQVQAMMVPLSVAIPQGNAHRVRILGVTSDQRESSATSVPTLIEQGIDVRIKGWHMLVVPNGTPRDVISSLSTALTNALKRPEVQETLSKIGIEPSLISPQQGDQFISAEWLKWGQIARDAKIKVDP